MKNKLEKSLVDTGATISCISKKLVDKLKLQMYMPDRVPLVSGFSGGFRPVIGQVELKFKVSKMDFTHKFWVFSDLAYSIILGIDFLTTHKGHVDLEHGKLILKGLDEVHFIQSTKKEECVKLCEETKFPPRSESIVKVRTQRSQTLTGLIEPSKTLNQHHLLGAKCFVSVVNNETLCQVMNPTAEEIILPANQVMGFITEIDEYYPMFKDSQDVTLQEQVSHINQIDPNSAEGQELIEIAKDLGINLEHSELTETQKTQLMIFIGLNRDVFAKSLNELGTFEGYSHRIDTGDAKPVRQRFYRTTAEEDEEIESQVNKLLEANIIEPSLSPWASPVVLVRKKDYSMRFAIDYRRVNQVSTPYNYPLPTLEDVWDCLGNAQSSVFSTLDLFSGYWQIKMEDSSKEKTAFTTKFGEFQWRKLPFGLMNAGASFSMVVTQVLRGLSFKSALSYVDDILCFSKNFTEHLEHLAEIFQRLRHANLKLKPGKCCFAATKVDYLGHVLSPKGVSPSKEKTKAVSEFPTPQGPTDVKSFLGMCGYFRRFIKSFANIASPLHALLKKDHSFT